MKSMLPKQCPIILCRLLFSCVVIFLCSAQYFAQYCTGKVTYLIRDESGARMTAAKLEKVVVKQINGEEAIKDKDSNGQVYYKINTLQGSVAVNFGNFNKFANSLLMDRLCGQINDLTLQYEKQTMKLIFENRDNWRRYVIDSLPFQEGIFRLKKKNEGGGRNYESTPCDEFIPSKQTGPLSYTGAICNVFAQSWLRIDEKKNQD